MAETWTSLLLAVGIPAIGTALAVGCITIYHERGARMTKKTRSPAQKLARKIQAETGKPYTACLAEAKQRLAELEKQ